MKIWAVQRTPGLLVLKNISLSAIKKRTKQIVL